MRKVKCLLMGLAIAGAMTGCGKNADDTEATTTQSTEVQSTTEEMSSTIESEVTSEVSSIEIETEITTEPVAQTSSPEEDEIYNYGMICGLGIDQEDAKKAAVYLNGISYGRIVSTERLELSNSTYIELKNNEQIVIYIYLLSDGKIKEITDMNLHTLLVISEESNSGASDNSAQPSSAQSSSTQSGGTANSAASNGKSEMIEEPVFGDYHNGLGYLEEEPVYEDIGNGLYHGD